MPVARGALVPAASSRRFRLQNPRATMSNLLAKFSPRGDSSATLGSFIFSLFLEEKAAKRTKTFAACG